MAEGKRGRPRNPGVEREVNRPDAKKWTLKAGANWAHLTEADLEDDTPDRLHFSRDIMPEGMDFQWVTDSVFGQPQPERRASFEKRGWTPVHQSDFDGAFDGKFMPSGKEGEIKMDGLVLMTRPMELSIRARARDRRSALEQVAVKEQGLMSGDIQGVGLDTRHASALKSNRINKSIERISIPED